MDNLERMRLWADKIYLVDSALQDGRYQNLFIHRLSSVPAGIEAHALAQGGNDCCSRRVPLSSLRLPPQDCGNMRSEEQYYFSFAYD